MNNHEKYLECEFERLRRKKNKEIEEMKYRQARLIHLTYDLLKGLGLSDTDIMVYYGTAISD